MHYNLSFFMIWWKSAILLVVMQVSIKLICSIILWETLTPRYDPNAVQLDCQPFVNEKLVKKYGYDAVLKPMLVDIKRLENGHLFYVDGEIKVVYGKVVSCDGDTKGQHERGGFKVGVGFALKKCRLCHYTFDAMQNNFLEENFTLRTKQTDKQQCT